MIIRTSTFFLGAFIFLIPFLGLPTFWKTFFTIFSGVTLILLSVKLSFPSLLHRKNREEIKPEIQSQIPPVELPVSTPPQIPEEIIHPPKEEKVRRPTTRKRTSTRNTASKT